jgi:hypothetical protein
MLRSRPGMFFIASPFLISCFPMNKTGLPGELDARRANRRSLHYAPPDFMWNLVASAKFMRLSLRRGAFAVLSGAAWQEIRVRSGRDDNSFAEK